MRGRHESFSTVSARAHARSAPMKKEETPHICAALQGHHGLSKPCDRPMLWESRLDSGRLRLHQLSMSCGPPRPNREWQVRVHTRLPLLFGPYDAHDSIHAPKGHMKRIDVGLYGKWFIVEKGIRLIQSENADDNALTNIANIPIGPAPPTISFIISDSFPK